MWIEGRARLRFVMLSAALLGALVCPMRAATAAQPSFVPLFAATSGNFFTDFMNLLSNKPKAEQRRIEAPIQVPGYGTTRRRDRKPALSSGSNSGGSGGFGGGIEVQTARPARSGGGYRTMCVRLCDGFYWPISNSASSSDFNADKRTCETSCMAPAKLYYQTDKGENPARMLGLDGKTYKSLDTAFAYRKSLQPACRCKADPWSSLEQARHQSYARNQPVVSPVASAKVASSIRLDMPEEPSADAGTLLETDTLAVP
jgi:Protein of unknown function (DUF2865)